MKVARYAKIFPIRHIAEKTGLKEHQIRYFEVLGLVRPARTEGSHRLFSRHDLVKILTIIKLKNDGCSLAGIKRRFQEKREPTLSKAKHPFDCECQQCINVDLL